MAYAALSSLAQTIHLILDPQKYMISIDQKQNIMSIHEYVFFLMIFLEYSPDAEKATRFEGLITDVANTTEDVLEYFMWNQIQSRYESTRRSTIGESSVEFEYQLERVTEEICSIAEEIMHIKKILRFKDDGLISDSPAAVSSSIFAPTGKNDEPVIGLDEDLLAIQEWVCGGSSKLEVIPIVGMGGIGKTTLARKAYDDRLIAENFDVRGWITVSQDYCGDEILSQLLASMKLLDKNGSGMAPAEKVYKSLKGRRYFIVIDDIWSSKAWDDISIILPDDNNGSRIMLTTRVSDVGAYADSAGSHVLKMKLMNEKQSWHLLKRKVFGNVQDCPPELEDIGKEIARSCRGLPLAVVLVAGILSSVINTRTSWEEISKDVISNVDEQLDKILSLSYRNLPHHLRSIFLYIGVFPEDYTIKVSRLIKLWVAEGLLEGGNANKSLEEEAEEYLEELVRKNLVLVSLRKSNGKIKTCGLHDLVRDLCIRKALEEKFLLHVSDRYYDLPKGTNNMRRISISKYRLKNIKGPTIRTIVGFRVKLGGWLSLTFVGRSRLLKVLDVADVTAGDSLPSQLFELFHLRYLSLRNPPWKLPAAISKLENLQTLVIIFPSDLKFCGCYFYFPPEIWRMHHLRHLIFSRNCMLPAPPDGSTLVLENLQTLSEVKGLVCSQNLLKMIPNLKKLGIIYLDKREYHLHNLVYLSHLEKLKLTMQGSGGWQGKIPAFPKSLKKLTLSGGGLPWNEMGIVGSLPSLEVLKLKDHACSGNTWETIDGEFPQLEFLQIQDSLLEHWLTEGSHFPRLMRLLLLDCPSLREIPDGIGEIPTLEVIEVDDQNKSLLDSAKQILKDQHGDGNDTLKVLCWLSSTPWKSLLSRFAPWKHDNAASQVLYWVSGRITPWKSLLSQFAPWKHDDAAYYMEQVALKSMMIIDHLCGLIMTSIMIMVYYTPHLSPYPPVSYVLYLPLLCSLRMFGKLIIDMLFETEMSSRISVYFKYFLILIFSFPLFVFLYSDVMIRYISRVHSMPVVPRWE